MSKIQNCYNSGIIAEDENFNTIDLCIKYKKLLRGADLRGANLRGADLSGADLRGANLYDADLYGADLRDADLRGADLRDADLRDANLRDANLRGADLRDANLRDADLRGANLYDADLRDADGNKKQIKSMQIEKYSICYTVDFIQIGCKKHLIGEWKNFTDDEIRKMDGNDGLHWWKKWKEIIFKIIEMSPAEK